MTSPRQIVLLLCALAIVVALPTPTGLDRSSDPTTARFPNPPAYSLPLTRLDRALGCRGGNGRVDGQKRHQPVLLVHATGMTPEMNWGWNYWRALPAAGFEVCWVRLPIAATGDLQLSAEYVARAVDVISARAGEKVDVIGHSQGGVVARWAIKYFPSGSRVDDYVALATPNHGTHLADAVLSFRTCPPACWQLARNSRLMAALNDGDETPGASSYTSIYTVEDEFVQPLSSASLRGATNIPIQRICPGRRVGHFRLAGDGATWEAVLDALVHPGPARLSRLREGVCTRSTLPRASGPHPRKQPDWSKVRVAHREPPLQPYAR